MSRLQKGILTTSFIIVAVLLTTLAALTVTSGAWQAAEPHESGGAAEEHALASPDDTATPPADVDEHEGPGEGYVSVGQGTWIPEGGPGDCTAAAWIHITQDDGEPWRAFLGGADLVDMGPAPLAAGEVSYDSEGRIATYTVAPGDALYAIGERFCIANVLTLPTLNGITDFMIHPGDVLVLNPDAVPGWEYVDPYG